jgi:hypothetical protein
MSEAERNYRRVANGEVLRRLDNGLMIVRRVKHEWTPRLARLKREALARETNTERGSKFVREWTLERCVEWLEARIDELGWNSSTGRTEHTFEEPMPVGYSNGQAVSKIRVVVSSRGVHMYPVDD